MACPAASFSARLVCHARRDLLGRHGVSFGQFRARERCRWGALRNLPDAAINKSGIEQ